MSQFAAVVIAIRVQYIGLSNLRVSANWCGPWLSIFPVAIVSDIVFQNFLAVLLNWSDTRNTCSEWWLWFMLFENIDCSIITREARCRCYTGALGFLIFDLYLSFVYIFGALHLDLEEFWWGQNRAIHYFFSRGKSCVCSWLDGSLLGVPPSQYSRLLWFALN